MRVAVIRFSALGDLVTLEPYLRAIVRSHAGDETTLITSAIGKSLYQAYFSRTIAVTPKRRGRWRQSGEIAVAAGAPFDLVYDLQSNTLAHLLAFRLGAARRIHLSGSYLLKWLGIKRAMRPIAELLTTAGQSPEIVASLLADDDSCRINLRHAIELTHPPDHLARLVDGAGELILIAPGASRRWQSKQWGEDSYAEIADHLVNAGYRVAMVGEEEESPLAAVATERNRSVVNLCGQTTLNELLWLAGEARLLIGNDSGPAHMAAAMGCDTVTVFGPTDTRHAASNHPYHGHHQTVAVEQLACRPCYQPTCPLPDHPCMSRVTPQRLLEVVGDLLGIDRS